MAPDYDVAIVGYGPTGATLANMLGPSGLRIAALDSESDVFALPRAAHYDGETMRVFQAAGLYDAMVSISRPGNKGMHFVSAQGQTLLVRAASDKPGPHGYANNWYFHQPSLERVLREGVERFANVDVLLGHHVTSVAQDAGGASLQVRDGDGKTMTLNARYVVGCDGARSLVREAIGTDMDDLGLHQPWLCMDMIMRRPVDLPEYSIQLCDPARPMTIVNMAGDRRRWEIMLMPGDDPQTIADPATVWPLLKRWITPQDASIERSAVYTFHSLIARRWRNSRLLIAGDAAHQTPPFLGQGMCAGIRDASNLAWKLSRVLNERINDRVDDDLLDTYETERTPHVRAFIELAVKMGDVIQTTDPEQAAERDRRFARDGAEVFQYPNMQLGPGVHSGAAMPVASVFPQPRLDDGRLLDDVTDGRFVLLAQATALNSLSATTLVQLHQLNVLVLREPGSQVSDWLSAHNACAVLIRPDRYILGLAATPHDLNPLLQLIGPRTR